MDTTAELESFLEEMIGRDVLSELEEEVMDLMKNPIPITPECGQSQGKVDAKAELHEFLEEIGRDVLCTVEEAFPPCPPLSLPCSPSPQLSPFPPLLPPSSTPPPPPPPPHAVMYGGFSPSILERAGPGLDQSQANPIFPGSVESQEQSNMIQVVNLPMGWSQSPQPLVFLTGPIFITAAKINPLQSAPPLPIASTVKSRKRKRRKEEGQPCVKRPPNAFMVFSMEQRPKLKAQLNTTNNPIICTVLGEMWTAMSKEEQARYFEEAHRLRRLHAP